MSHSPSLNGILGAQGRLAASIPGYEFRQPQIDMAEMVERAIQQKEHAIVEAPTGVGKSFAYLLPVLRSGRKVVVSTAYKSLQTQLYDKDIPDLAQILDMPDLKVELAKGRGNYICHYKWHNYMDEFGQQTLEDAQGPLPVIQEIELGLETDDFQGDVEYLENELVSGIRKEIVSSPQDCVGHACQFASNPCYVDSMRGRAAAADVVVTNHHLLLTSLKLAATEGKHVLLPEAEVYIIDEAHHLEAVATAVFETLLDAETAGNLLFHRMLRPLFAQVLTNETMQRLRAACGDLLNAAMTSADDKGILKDPLPEAAAYGALLLEAVKAMDTAGPPRTLEGESDPEVITARHERALASLQTLATDVDSMADHDPDFVRYVSGMHAQRSADRELHRAPLSPAKELRRLLFEPPDTSVICTSATLTTRGSFGHFTRQCGLGAEEVRTHSLPHIFDYANNALIYQPPVPDFDYRNPEPYYQRTADVIRSLLEVSRGRTMCLFTSWKALDWVVEILQAEATGIIWPLRSQRDGNKRTLLEWFQTTPHGVLCATRSFWEGIDIPGDALVSVVLDKLPFPSPADPIHSARMELIDSLSENVFERKAFPLYSVPHAALALKQGFGRLIRRQSDRGVVTVVDSRLATKPYGRQFLAQDLPPARFTRRVADVHRFFQDEFGYRASYGLNVHRPSAEGEAPLVEMTVLRDGRTDRLPITANPEASPDRRQAGYLAAALQGLRQRIEAKGARALDYELELRCPQSWCQSQTTRNDPELRTEIDAWSAVHWIGLS